MSLEALLGMSTRGLDPREGGEMESFRGDFKQAMERSRPGRREESNERCRWTMSTPMRNVDSPAEKRTSEWSSPVGGISSTSMPEGPRQSLFGGENLHRISCVLRVDKMEWKGYLTVSETHLLFRTRSDGGIIEKPDFLKPCRDVLSISRNGTSGISIEFGDPENSLVWKLRDVESRDASWRLLREHVFHGVDFDRRRPSQATPKKRGSTKSAHASEDESMDRWGSHANQRSRAELTRVIEEIGLAKAHPKGTESSLDRSCPASTAEKIETNRNPPTPLANMEGRPEMSGSRSIPKRKDVEWMVYRRPVSSTDGSDDSGMSPPKYPWSDKAAIGTIDGSHNSQSQRLQATRDIQLSPTPWVILSAFLALALLLLMLIQAFDAIDSMNAEMVTLRRLANQVRTEQ